MKASPLYFLVLLLGLILGLEKSVYAQKLGSGGGGVPGGPTIPSGLGNYSAVKKIDQILARILTKEWPRCANVKVKFASFLEFYNVFRLQGLFKKNICENCQSDGIEAPSKETILHCVLTTELMEQINKLKKDPLYPAYLRDRFELTEEQIKDVILFLEQL